MALHRWFIGKFVEKESHTLAVFVEVIVQSSSVLQPRDWFSLSPVLPDYWRIVPFSAEGCPEYLSVFP